MTYYGGPALAASFRQVRDNTIRIAEDIPDNKYDFKGAPECRSIRATLVHIAFGPRFQQHIQGKGISDLSTVNFPVLVQAVMAEEAPARSKSDIIALLKAEGETFGSYLERLSDSVLAEPVLMPPGMQPASKTRFEMLLSPKEHEMHHRGQLMLLQRMIGLTPHLTRQMQERMAQRAEAAPTPQ
jgi:uncharacterized damage-inducible protein DinB